MVDQESANACGTTERSTSEVELGHTNGVVAQDQTLPQHGVAPSVVGLPEGPATLGAPMAMLGPGEKRRKGRGKKRRQERIKESHRRHCLVLSIVSTFDIAISGLMACVAFAHAYLDSGVSLYCLGMQSLSHGLSSCCLALRFFDELRLPKEAPAGPEEGLLHRRRRAYLVRERCISITMGIVMYCSSAAFLFKAIRKALFWDVWYQDHKNMDRDAAFATVFLSWYGVCVYSLQAVVRGVVGAALKRAVVRDSVAASAVSLVFLLVLGIASTFEREWSWKAEPFAAMVLAVCSIGEGTRLLCTHKGDVDRRLELDPYA